jgi:hypothetical protein
MSPESREATERAIERVLLDQWDPLGVREQPGPRAEYAPYVHDVYSLLARGASDVQIARHLHRIESEELHLPELASRDLTAIVRALRKVESSL